MLGCGSSQEGCDTEIGEGQHLSIPLHSKWLWSTGLTAWPGLSSCLQGLNVSWGMCSRELIGRHFIISSSWWQTETCPFYFPHFFFCKSTKCLKNISTLSLLSSSCTYSILHRVSGMTKTWAKSTLCGDSYASIRQCSCVAYFHVKQKLPLDCNFWAFISKVIWIKLITTSVVLYKSNMLSP